MKLEYKLPLLAVKDVQVSKKFYCDVLDQTVIVDLGWNITFSGGFAIQQEFAWLCDLPRETVLERSHNMELYFEVDDFDAWLEKLSGFAVELLHPPKKHEWLQRVSRFYDPDGHIIEIGESMAVIAKRLLSEGKTPEETAKLIRHPLSFVLAVKGDGLKDVPEIRLGRYRHFRGNEYELLYVARSSETLEPVVVYRALYGNRDIWVRPAAMWDESVEHDGKKVSRFTYIGK